jgi:uncharacterized membrane protein
VTRRQDPLICPRCGGSNAPDAVFCANPVCGKALGEFRYVREEIDAGSSWLQRQADRVSAWVGHPHFISIHVAWFALWVVVNSGRLGVSIVFDRYPYGLLGIILAVEAALITSMLLISNNRRSQFDAKQAELEYEANISSYRLLRDLVHDFDELRTRIETLERDKPR